MSVQEFVNALLKLKVNASTRNHGYRTPLDLAAIAFNRYSIMSLVVALESFDAADWQGDFALPNRETWGNLSLLLQTPKVCNLIETNAEMITGLYRSRN